MNVTGIVQLYVASYSWTTSNTCSENPTSVEAVMADANCHPASSEGGAVTQWISVNCNGGRPIYKTCSDSRCSKCEVSQNTGNCESLGASASKKVMCLYPPGWNKDKGGIDTEEASSASRFGISLPAVMVGLIVLI